MLGCLTQFALLTIHERR